MKLRALSIVTASLLFGMGCTVPSLKDLESEQKRACDADHACVSGYQCVSGFCEAKTGGNGTCAPGATQSCGSDVGECVAGTQTCQANGQYGACEGSIGPVAEVCDGKDNDCDGQTDEEPVTSSCGVNVGVCANKNKACIAGSEEAVCTVASFGGEYQPVETACDGKDNDCDGQTDENLFNGCALDAGVCAGTTQACRDGGFGSCSAADYLAHNSKYELYEMSCDSLDNDCDGLKDSWSAKVVSDVGGGKVRRAVAAVTAPDAGTGPDRDLLLFYEDGSRVAMRPFTADGQLGTPVAPAASVTVADKAYGPALATDFTTMAAAWFDQLNGPPPTYRLQVGLPRNTGESFVGGAPGAVPVAVLTGPGLTISMAAVNGRLAIAYDYLDQSVSPAVPRVAVANCPLTLGSSCGTKILTTGASTGQNPTIAIDNTGLMHVAYEDPGNGVRYQQVSGTSTLVATASTSATSTDVSPRLFVGAQVELYTISPSEARIKKRTCGVPCSGVPANAVSVAPAFPGVMSNLQISDSGRGILVAVEVLNGNSASEIDVAAASDTTTAPTLFSNPSANAFRPIIVQQSRSGPPAITVLWDTEGATAQTGVTPDVVYARRSCF